MVKRFGSGGSDVTLQPSGTFRSGMYKKKIPEQPLTQEQIQAQQEYKQKIEQRNQQISSYKNQIQDLTMRITERNRVGDTNTARMLLAERSAIIQVLDKLEAGFSVEPEKAESFISRKKELTTFSFQPKQTTKPTTTSISSYQQEAYRKAGFTQAESRILAEEGARRQQSISPEGARQVLAERKFMKENPPLIKSGVLEGFSLFNPDEEEKPPSIAKAPEKKSYSLLQFGTGDISSGLGLLSSSISERRQRLEVQSQRGKGTFFTKAGATGLEFVSLGVGTVESIVNFPETIKGVYQSAKDPKGTIISFREKVSRQAQISPSSFVGGFLGGALLVKLPKAIPKVSDYVRTTGLKEVSATKVIAPEYFKGQTFPTIKKGQTAGQLLQEFKTQGYGYTASPKPFAKTTTAGKGSSEIAGVYQAPKVSPHFLRVSGEETKLFSLKMFDTLRPSAMRITPESFELAIGVSPKQKSLASLKESKAFIESAPKGKSYVSFIKAEKESIIPYATPLQQTGKNVFFEFEGRKIPIMEFKTTGSTKAIKTISTGDLTKMYSSRRLGGRGFISPYELGLSSSALSKISSTKYSGVSSTTSKAISSFSPRKPISKSQYISMTRGSKKTIPYTSGYGGYTGYGYSTGYGKSGGYIGGSSYRGGYTGYPKGTTTSLIGYPKPSKSRKKRGDFMVSIRRYGKFKPIGTGLSLQKAMSIGKRKTATTLGATFKITPTSRQSFLGLGTPAGYKRKTTKGGILFIEQPKYRLSTGSEIGEIQFAKKRRRKKKK